MGTAPTRDIVLDPYAQKLIQYKARQLSRWAGRPRVDEEDLRQDLTLHLLRRSAQFDSSRGSLHTFIDRVLSSGAAAILRSQRRLKRGAGAEAVSLEATMILVDGTPTPARQVVSEEDLCRRTGTAPRCQTARREDAEAIRVALGRMTPGQRELCGRLMDGTITSVARDLEESRRQVRRAIAHLRPYFEQAGLGNCRVRRTRRLQKA